MPLIKLTFLLLVCCTIITECTLSALCATMGGCKQTDIYVLLEQLADSLPVCVALVDYNGPAPKNLWANKAYLNTGM